MPAPALIHALADKLHGVLLSPASSVSLQSLACALAIAAGYLAWRRLSRDRRLDPRLIWRALFPRWLTRSASTRADLGFLAFNLLAAGALFGWAIVSSHALTVFTAGALAGAFGAARPSALPAWAGGALATLGVFLAYEFGYWLDHYLKHRIPVLWAFHKVHHTAETLTPMTNFRVHPVDSILFLNMVALTTGLAGGVLTYLLGGRARAFAIDGGNVILLAGLFLLIHLQHSHIWIASRGLAGRIIISPAHHQLHHSDNPEHFNSNFGGCLAIWDWLFGTLLIPPAKRQRLTFGAPADGIDPHSVTGAVVAPLIAVWRMAAAALGPLVHAQGGAGLFR